MHGRHTATQLLPFLFATGCWLSHDRGVVPPMHPLPAADAGSPFTPPDAAIPVEDAGLACGVATEHVDVTVEPRGGPPATCMVSHVDDITILGVDAEPATNGIRIHADFCPGDDADCPCDIVVTNTGTDVAAQLAPEAHVGLDVAAGFGGFVALTHRPTCECDGCPCSLSFLFYAADADPDRARSVPSDVAFATGAEVCPAPSTCVSGSWELGVQNRAVGVSRDVPQGATLEVGGIEVRSVRDVSVFAPCADCATCGSRAAGWVAWLSLGRL